LDCRITGVEQPSGIFVWMVQGVARAGEVIAKNKKFRINNSD